MTDVQFENCIQRICSGDSNGLKSIYTEYVSFIYQTVFQLVHQKEDAEDITADFFVRLYSLAKVFHSGNGHRGWLATIARNQTIDFLRKHRREIPTSDFTCMDDEGNLGHAYNKESDVSSVASSSDSCSSPVENEVISSVSLTEALSYLSTGEREIVTMKILGELTFREISQILDKPMGTVTWAYQNALKKLRRCGYESASE